MKKRIDNLDLMKAYAMIAVMLLHASQWNYMDFVQTHSVSDTIEYFIRLMGEGVPIFLTINGFLLLKRESYDLNKHLKRIGKIVVLMLIWSAVLVLVGAFLAEPREELTLYSFINYILNTHVYSEYTGVFWFFEELVATYLLYPVIKLVLDSNRSLYKYLFIIMSVFTMGSATIKTIYEIGNYFTDCSLLYAMYSLLGTFNPISHVQYLYYFMLGGMIWIYYEKIVEKRIQVGIIGLIAAGTSVVLGYGVSYMMGTVYRRDLNYDSIFETFILLGFFAFTIPYKNKGTLLHRLIASVGQNSMSIYLIHYIFIFIQRRYLPMVIWKDRIIGYSFIVIMSCVTAIIISKIPKIKWLVTM